ncbi:MAG: KilA-N domain-containing protein [Hydrogenophaga sp.]|nr:KilA-N domain-containing protein [Hydrogenophaga sp.]
MQEHFNFIPHNERGVTIYQRPKDGYINATAMCQAAGRPWSRYWETTQAKEFAAALSSDIGIPISDAIQSVKGGEPRMQGTWVHPQVAIHLAQWLSPNFAVRVSKWVFDWMSGSGPKRSEMPYHLRRYVANQSNVPIGHFSILAELTMALIGPMEHMGYTLPENMVPDISHGRMFCKWLRDKHGIDTDALPTYWHVYEDGRRVQAKAYPESLLADWRKHFREEWLPNRAVAYFTGRDNSALAFLPRLLPPPSGGRAA